jgi:hypothetical protein
MFESSLDKALGEARYTDMLVVDAALFGEEALYLFLQKMSTRKGPCITVADLHHQLRDPGRLFHCGAVDYLTEKSIQQMHEAGRKKQLSDYILRMYEKYEELTEEEIKNEHSLSGDSWTKIKSGREYSFLFLFVELDYKEQWKQNYGDKIRNTFLVSFANYLEEAFSVNKGKIWIWNDFGGIILFPFNGKTIRALETCFKYQLNKTLICVEEFDSNPLMSFRMVLHIGNTVYQTRGKTDEIISDTINTIYHLGQQKAQPGKFYITKDVHNLAPAPLKEYFISEGAFDELEVFRMKELK